jgi:Uma2 family endonuclease
MLAQTLIAPTSIADYLQQEQQATLRHEYVDGYLFAMAGGSKAHNQIATNVVSLIRPQIRGTSCRVYMADMKVATENCFYYPDVVVTCHADQETEEFYLTQPCLIIEVLSPSTQHIDKREKLLAYQRIESLESYLIIAQDQPWIEHYQRVATGWSLNTYAEPAMISLSCIALDVLLTAIYEDVLNFGGGRKL